LFYLFLITNDLFTWHDKYKKAFLIRLAFLQLGLSR
jgi:hypothetical protein